MWNESFALRSLHPNDRIHVRVCDSDISLLGKESFSDLGEVYVSIAEIMSMITGGMSERYFELTGPKAAGEVGGW